MADGVQYVAAANARLFRHERKVSHHGCCIKVDRPLAVLLALTDNLPEKKGSNEPDVDANDSQEQVKYTDVNFVPLPFGQFKSRFDPKTVFPTTDAVFIRRKVGGSCDFVEGAVRIKGSVYAYLEPNVCGSTVL